jgi:hypothetical protein
MTYIVPFTRRWNRDSSIDSICTKCFRTIASSNSEDELSDRENKHVCHPNGEFIRGDAASHHRRSLSGLAKAARSEDGI